MSRLARGDFYQHPLTPRKRGDSPDGDRRWVRGAPGACLPNCDVTCQRGPTLNRQDGRTLEA